MTELTVGRVVQGLQARYTVERALGAGGFGMTYLARRGDGEAVVLKQLRLARMTDWKALELFEREARVLAALSHPGIPKLYEFFALDGESPRAPAALYSSVAGPSPAAPPSPSLSLVIAQAYVEGRSLQAWIDEGGRWAADDAEAVLRRLLDVLKYLHSLNPPVIHRDIKPANVVLGTDGKAYLVDFGAIQDRLRGTAEAGSTTVGSFGFFPQEQLLGKARPASDLYALGMTLMCALTHLQPEELPLDEQTSKVQVRVAAPYLPERLARALEAMLEPAVGQRAASTDEVAGILDGLTPASAMVAAPRAALVRSEPSVSPVLWRVPLIGGIGVTAAVYLLMFNEFSETELVEMSFLWGPVIAFGLALRRAAYDPLVKRPVVQALGFAIGSFALLVFFFAAIFPAL
jgi:serine/threonine protein kinase